MREARDLGACLRHEAAAQRTEDARACEEAVHELYHYLDGELTEEDHARLELPRHALHAARVALAHPVTGAPLVIEAPFPDDLRAFWDERA